MSDEQKTEFTRKGDAFTRYFYIDRGNEKELTIEKAMVDFENYIYRPVAEDVTMRLVTEIVNEALGKFVDLDSDPESMTEEDAQNVSQFIGDSFLGAYIELHAPKSDA